jgi:hypothetical protein
MSISLASIRNQLLPGLMEITGEYDQIAPEWEGIFVTKVSNLNQERSLQVRYTGIAQQKTEGGQTPIDNQSGDRWAYTMEPIEAGIMYSITRKAVDDGLYKSEFRPANLGLQQSMRAFWNTQAAYILNTASTYVPAIGGDGKALLATDHPVDTGTFANTSSVPLALNEASLIGGAKGIRKNFVDEAGILQDIFAEDLIVPTNLEDVAIRLLKTDLRPGTGNNDVNVIPTMAGGIKNYKVLRYLTSDFPWFLTTTVKGLIHLERIPFEMDMFVDFDTDNLKVKSYERGGFFYNDPRALWGQMATS